ncbi:MAG: 4-hydroxythreonine-4-phosphate dehydrogenase [Verrucomicrobiales bacterium]|nr:4-hydroxythreonine-4-phosphate dehydrogenase [Verrucomicrobiales bacterium]
MTGWIAISIGDVTGIGPEVTLKALASELPVDSTRYLLIGDDVYLDQANRRLDLRIPLEPFESFASSGRVFVHSPSPVLPDGLSAGAPEAARSVVEWLREGARLCLSGDTDALVTAPVNKEAIIRAGHSTFVGQTEFLSGIAGTDRTVMMLLGADEQNRWLRVALATTHVPIRAVADSLTADKIILAIERAVEACQLLGLPRTRVGVCGLNPHAGEGGKIGTEEQTVIIPAVGEARRRTGADIAGPMAADTLFHYAFRGDYDAIVAMYHDQGLAPLKMIGFETGVNWTLGLPFIRTSPDHGTAYDIAGKGVASPSSMISALRLAKKLASR